MLLNIILLLLLNNQMVLNDHMLLATKSSKEHGTTEAQLLPGQGHAFVGNQEDKIALQDNTYPLFEQAQALKMLINPTLEPFEYH